MTSQGQEVKSGPKIQLLKRFLHVKFVRVFQNKPIGGGK